MELKNNEKYGEVTQESAKARIKNAVDLILARLDRLCALLADQS